MTKSDMIGAVDDDDEELNDHNHGGGITVQVPRSRVGMVMDDDDEDDHNVVVQGVLVSRFNSVCSTIQVLKYCIKDNHILEYLETFFNTNYFTG